MKMYFRVVFVYAQKRNKSIKHVNAMHTDRGTWHRSIYQ